MVTEFWKDVGLKKKRREEKIYVPSGLIIVVKHNC